MLPFLKDRKWLVFCALSIVLYLPAYKYGVVKDFLSWIEKYDAGSFSDIIHCFEYHGLHQFFHLINYSFYQLAGTNHLVWAIWFAFLHGVNASLVYAVAKSFKSHDDWIPYFASLIFLFSPLQAEVLVWNACMHYLLVTLFLLLSIKLLFEYLEVSSARKLFLIHGCVLLSLFTLELSLAFPFILLFIAAIFGRKLKETILKLFLPQLCMLIGWFMLNKWYLGDWVGHYGSEKHLNFDLGVLFSNGINYLIKSIGFLSFAPYNLRDLIYGFVHSSTGRIVIFIPVVILVLYFIFSFKKLSTKVQSTGTALILFFLSLFPIANLYFYYLSFFTNDRYGYLSMAFIGIFLGSFFSLIKKPIGRTLMIIYLAITILLSFYMVLQIQKAGTLKHQFLESFVPCEEDKEYFFLTLPENYKGIYLFGDYKNEMKFFRLGLHYHSEQRCVADIYRVAEVNINQEDDRFEVYAYSSDSLRVSIAQGGNWFWKKGLGLQNYDNEKVAVTLNGWYYNLKIIHPNSNQVFVWHSGNKWKYASWEQLNSLAPDGLR